MWFQSKDKGRPSDGHVPDHLVLSLVEYRVQRLINLESNQLKGRRVLELAGTNRTKDLEE